MITIDLDTSCFDKTEISNNKGVIIELAKLQNEGMVKLYYDDFVKMETGDLNGVNGLIVSTWIRENSSVRKHNCSVNINSTDKEKKIECEVNRGYTSEEFHNVANRVGSIILKYNNRNNPYSLNDYKDMRILIQHILEKGDFFLSKDKIFHKNGKRNIKAELEKEFPMLKIRKPDEHYLKEIKELSNH